MLSRRTFIGQSLAASAVLLTGCRKKEGATIRVGVLPISDSLPIYLAQKNGYFERNNISTQLVPLDGGAKVISAMAGGSIDFGVSNYVSQMLARESGLDVRLVSGNTVETKANPQHALMVARASRLTVRELAGKRIAVNTRKNINELFMRDYLAQAGVDPASISFVELPFPRMLAALEGGAVDAAGVFEPFVTFGGRSNVAKPLARFVVDVEDSVPITGWLSPAAYLNANKETALRFREAIRQAIIDINKDPAGAKALLPTFTKLTAQDADAVPLVSFVADTPPPTLGSLVNRVRKAGWITEKASRLDEYVLAE
jgi:NitT/TauT family transport system substrate-binding protein